MMNRLLTFVQLGCLAAVLGLSACNKEVIDTPPTQNPTVPMSTGNVTLRTGTMQPQGGVPSGGTLATERDAPNTTEFVRFDASFTTDFHTGSLGVYLANSDQSIRVQRAADPNSVLRVGTITRTGAQTLAIPGRSAGFSHVVIYCEPAQYNFGAARLQ